MFLSLIPWITISRSLARERLALRSACWSTWPTVFGATEAASGAVVTWAQLEREALAFKRKSSDNLGIAVQQGSGGDAYHMYPFFSGLCGYIFQQSKSGALNPHKIGVAYPKFLKNASLVDKWNREGLINSKVTSGTAQTAFLGQKAAFWITGPWNSDTLKKSGLSFRIIQVPKIKCASVPFLGVQGFAVTKFASDHGVSSLAKDFVVNYLTKPSAQLDLSQASGRYPANTVAGKQVHDSVLAQFGRAGAGGVPMPNIPEMASVWGDLGGAWVNATKGSGATPARAAAMRVAVPAVHRTRKASSDSRPRLCPVHRCDPPLRRAP